MVLNNDETFGAIVRKRRSDLNLSQSALAEMLGVTHPTVARWEADQTFPKTPELGPLAGALQVSLEVLLAPLENRIIEAAPTTRARLDEIVDRLDRIERMLGQLLDEPRSRRGAESFDARGEVT